MYLSAHFSDGIPHFVQPGIKSQESPLPFVHKLRLDDGALNPLGLAG